MSDHLPTKTRQRSDLRPMRSLVAASKRISDAKIKRSHVEGWQEDAWDHYDEVGELRFAGNIFANALSRASLFPALLGDDDDEPVAVDREENGGVVHEVFDALGGGRLQRAELLRRLSLQLFVPGDGYLVGLRRDVWERKSRTEASPADGIGPTETADALLTELDWHALSVTEVKVRAGSGMLSLSLGDRTLEVDEEDAVVIRVWRPHPRRWWAADSPVRANLPILRELVGLTKHVGANIDSRLAGAGLLVIGQSVTVSTGATDDSPDPDDTDAEGDPVTAALIEGMVTPIKDRDSAASVVPIVLTVPDDAVDLVKHISFSTPFDAEARQLREEAIRRLALGLDLPPEVLLGLGDTNHWSAWQIEESTVKTHVEPVLSLICDALTQDYLRPALEAAGVADADRYVVWFDTSALTLRPNRAPEAQALFDRKAISRDALRSASGFDDSDAPPEDEQTIDPAVQTALDLVTAAPSLIAAPGLPALVEQIRAVMGGQEAPPVETDDPEDIEGTGMDLPEPDAEVENDLPALASSGRQISRNGASR